MLKEVIYKLDHSMLALLISIIQDIVHGNITNKESLNKMAEIDDNFTKITALKSFNSNQIKVTNT